MIQEYRRQLNMIANERMCWQVGHRDDMTKGTQGKKRGHVVARRQIQTLHKNNVRNKGGFKMKQHMTTHSTYKQGLR